MEVEVGVVVFDLVDFLGMAEGLVVVADDLDCRGSSTIGSDFGGGGSFEVGVGKSDDADFGGLTTCETILVGGVALAGMAVEACSID